jgi:hypothetical protein
MPHKISKGVQNRVTGIVKQLDNIAKYIGLIDEPQITELLRRASIGSTPDGFGPGKSLGEGGGRGGSTEDGISRPTESMALNQRRTVDPVKAQAKKIQDWIWNAEADLADAVDALKYINIQLEEEKERPTTVPCLVCQLLPATKRGMCDSDYHDWWKHGKPDFQAWVFFKTKQRNQENLLLVSECPPPSDGNKAIRGPHKAK